MTRRPLLLLLLLLQLLLLLSPGDAKRITRPPPTLPAQLEVLPRAPSPPLHPFFALARRWDAQRGDVKKQDMECHRVHEFEDKCKFVLENCADEEVGFFDYLKLYYCWMPTVPAVPFAIMAAWLVMLFTTIGIAASDFFCINLSTIANILGMSESMAGVTFLAFGNGSPDVFSTFAAMKINSGSLAVGELIGAASFIAAVVAGSMAIVHPFRVGRKSFVRDVCFFIVAVLFGIFFLADGQIQMWECAVMVVFYAFYVCFVVVWHWLEKSRKQRRRRERMMREYHVPPEEEDLLVDEDEDGGVGETDGLMGGVMHDFGALERGGVEEEEEDEEEEEREAYAEFSNAMRISRPRMERSMTPATPHSIRPSLVGALEFRAVLNHLERTKNLPGRPIHLRRYSDDPFLSVFNTASAPGSLIADSSSLYSSVAPEPDSHASRLRAVSVNDAAHVHVDWEHIRPHRAPTPDINLTLASPSSKSSKSQYPLINTSPPLSRARTPDLLALPTVHTHPNLSRPSPTSSEPTIPLLDSLPRLLVPETSSGSDTSSLLVFESPHPLPSRSISPTSIRLPPPSLDSELPLPPPQYRTVPYWPYTYLPPPQHILATLFPTLRGWCDKSFIEKALALIALPPVFLLTTTLPVVESEAAHSDKPTVVLDGPDNTNNPSASKPWNRWLVCLQCITAPVFIVLMFGLDPADPHAIIKPTLYALIAGLVSLGALLSTTTPLAPPRWRYALCFAGFAVSISWISAIANEVVGVLKAFGVILGISDAILGLTIFAVGNSLGDLVADITVARLGFPVMALSACFGGPMLNILLGIGISGLYITLSRAEHEPYQIEVSSTLIISAATLLVTLVLLLVAVPWNGWVMSRGIGVALIAVWVVSTVVNLGVEIGGGWGGVRGGGL